MAVNPGTCIDCGTIVPTLRCAPCQRRHNDRLRADHDLSVRAMFRGLEGRVLGRSTTGGRRRRSSSAEASPGDSATL